MRCEMMVSGCSRPPSTKQTAFIPRFKILRETVNLVLDTSLALEKFCFTTKDHKEAIDAFLEKREPKFTGHCSAD